MEVKVGPPVGKTLAGSGMEMVGAADGANVGWMVGGARGIALGLSLGALVGDVLGKGLGLSLGEVEGKAVGCFVGNDDGSAGPIGLGDGAFVELLVGGMLGLDGDGADVGLTLGSTTAGVGKALGVEDGSICSVGNSVGETEGGDEGGVIALEAAVGTLLEDGSIIPVVDNVGDAVTERMEGEEVAGLRDGAYDAPAGSVVVVADGPIAADDVGEVEGQNVGGDEGKSAAGLADGESESSDGVKDGAREDDDGARVEGVMEPGRVGCK